ncbi:RDD family protein [Pustulibacterium marinum]|uniref:RDD family protein n=1 Tax=Pustulibacterium marinum TaxID=1224947 RepID=A0A1I7ISW9_9FLAO|nr:RDD family protein [Pustulibacterium marinum]SFU75971.1 RDD family protein [Pustulibacterium marinum]
MERISELYTIQQVTRRKHLEGERHLTEERPFQVPLDVNVSVLYKRVFAKLIDMGIITLLMFGLHTMNLLNSDDVFLLFSILFFGTIVFVGCVESILKTSPGKALLGLMVVDDYGNKLPLGFTIYKNIMAFVYAVFYTIVSLGSTGIDSYENWQEKRKFHVLKRNQFKNIQEMMRMAE